MFFIKKKLNEVKFNNTFDTSIDNAGAYGKGKC